MDDDLVSRLPKYQRIAYLLREDIRSGIYLPGQRIPTERELMERFGVSLGTVRQGLMVLRQEGLIEPRHGSGTFVLEL